ncbi:MAG: DUF393 domain-containing protein [Saprospirales bacterium]|nr:MAG: DUF393 domain-containing protein [Saprospirales bacterium]
MSGKKKHILLYDGHCLMCSSLVRKVMKRDKKGQIYFGALQDEKMVTLIKQAPDYMQKADSVLLYSEGRFFYRSSAVLKLYTLLGLPYSLLTVFFIVPTFIRDFVYRIIAKYRKKWFGSSKSCYLVPAEKQALFLTDPTKNYNIDE